jgi:hypothetical protein
LNESIINKALFDLFYIINVVNMASLDKSTIDSLRQELSTAAKIVLKGDEDYKDSIKRWSAAAEKEAVSNSRVPVLNSIVARPDEL